MDIKQKQNERKSISSELSVSRGGRPGLPGLMVSVDVKQHSNVHQHSGYLLLHRSYSPCAGGRDVAGSNGKGF